MTVDTADRFADALAHHEAGRVGAAETLYLDILAREPDHAESLHLLGLIRVQRGDPVSGASLIQRAMTRAPGRAPHHNSLAMAWCAMGRNEDAVSEYRAASALRPDSPEILNNLAAALRAFGQRQEAIALWRRAIALAPGVAEPWYNLAEALADLGDALDASACFRRAIELRPDFAAAIAGYGRWLTTQGRWPEAEATLRDAVRFAPGDARSWNNLGVACQELGRAGDAAASYRHAIQIDPAFADAHYNLGCLLSGEGETDAAIACHEAALAADPAHGAARIAVCMARLPILYRDEAEVASRRADYVAALRRLAVATDTPEVARAVAGAIGGSQPFFLPYQGHADRDPQTMYGQLACRLLAREPYRPPVSRPAARERIRVGIVSGYFQDHTIWRLFLAGWLTQFDRARFQLIGFHTGLASDATTVRAADLCDRFVTGPRSGDAWRDAVSDMAPHVLLYPEVGMDPVSGRLAAQRLAPVQCVAWGHPETTGMPTMDYFLSVDLMEPPGAEADYTERLVRLPGLGVHYTPEPPVTPLDRASLGLDPAAPVYWSGQALYKYLPRFDCVFPRIARAVGACRFMFIGFAKSEAVTRMFRQRLGEAFAGFGLDAGEYCAILPPMPQQRFLAAVGMADVVLDTPGWSGGRSTLDCLAMNPAIVTLPGALMRGRHTAAILRQIGCDMTIAGSIDEYVAIAVRLGRDAAWRGRVRRAVAEGKGHAVRDAEPIRALESFLVSAATRA